MSVVYSLYDALVSIKVPDEKAKAVIDALEREMMDKLATKSDLAHVRDILLKDISAVEARLEHKMDLLGSKLTIQLGGLMVVLLGLMYTLLRH